MKETAISQRAVTIPDIAYAAGVSSTTVSLVINGKAARYRISEATRSRVEAVIAQSGYQPNRMARNMKLGRGTLVGLVLAEGMADVGELIAGLDPILAGAGYSLTVASIGTDPAAARERIRCLNHDGLAGLIYGPGLPVGSQPILAGLGPTIVLGLPVAGLPAVFHEDEEVGPSQPASAKRSERRRGQVAGELLLAMLAGAAPANRRVPLDRPAKAVETPVVTGVSPVPAAEDAADIVATTVHQRVAILPPANAVPVQKAPVVAIPSAQAMTEPEPTPQETFVLPREELQSQEAVETTIPVEPSVQEQRVVETQPIAETTPVEFARGDHVEPEPVVDSQTTPEPVPAPEPESTATSSDDSQPIGAPIQKDVPAAIPEPTETVAATPEPPLDPPPVAPIAQTEQDESPPVIVPESEKPAEVVVPVPQPEPVPVLTPAPEPVVENIPPPVDVVAPSPVPVPAVEVDPKPDPEPVDDPEPEVSPIQNDATENTGEQPKPENQVEAEVSATTP